MKPTKPEILAVAILLAGVTARDIASSNEPRPIPERSGEREGDRTSAPDVTLNDKAEGYRGIWYMNQPSNDEYVYKYSGGLGTYCAKHQPFAVYRPEVRKTFFCYGGAAPGDNRHLLHMVSYYDHETGLVPRPTILLDKRTSDAHDNPVITIDERGHLWIFSTSHGRSRPSYIHRSREPYSIDEFERVGATHRLGGRDVPIENFSYLQAWHAGERGFICFFTRYADPAARTTFFMTSEDGVRWSEWRRLAAIEEGHYQISAVWQPERASSSPVKAGAAFNYHPRGRGLNWRTNLYWIETDDLGKTWRAAGGTELALPLDSVASPALVHDYASEGLNVYLKDVRFDPLGRPVVLFITSRGYESGPKNDPRQWTTARFTGESWEIRAAFRSDNNYDMGSLWFDRDEWIVIAPTETGPQPYNPGGEVALWSSRDRGATWTRERQLTRGSERNHTYVRRPVDAHPDFFALWADGHGRKPSDSSLYFTNRSGEKVWRLPREMEGDFAAPELVENDAESPRSGEESATGTRATTGSKEGVGSQR